MGGGVINSRGWGSQREDAMRVRSRYTCAEARRQEGRGHGKREEEGGYKTWREEEEEEEEERTDEEKRSREIERVGSVQWKESRVVVQDGGRKNFEKEQQQKQNLEEGGRGGKGGKKRIDVQEEKLQIEA
eukprot:760529-Hanusia_phi.AAC.4